MNKRDLKVTLGALVGSLIVSGSTYAILNKQAGRTLIPFYKETIKEYSVNKKILSINYTNSGKNDTYETIDNEYILEEQLKKINAIELTVHSPWATDEQGVIYKKIYKYTFSNPLSSKDLEKKIELLEDGNFDELVKDCTWFNTYIESPIILPEESREENFFKAEMTIRDVNYNEYTLEKQSLDDDFYETIILVFSALMGGGLGALAQETINIENEIINMEPKVKKKTKKKTIDIY